MLKLFLAAAIAAGLWTIISWLNLNPLPIMPLIFVCAVVAGLLSLDIGIGKSVLWTGTAVTATGLLIGVVLPLHIAPPILIVFGLGFVAVALADRIVPAADG